MNCKKCGSYVPEESIFCPHCGSRVNGSRSGGDNKLKKLILPAAIAACVVVVLVLVLVLSLMGSPADDAQKAISAIGTVDMGSLEKIQKAESIYDDLSEKDKAKVENAAVLADARKTYDNMVSTVDAASKLIDAAKNVTYYVNGEPCVDPKNRDIVLEARAAYQTVDAAGLAGYLGNQVDDLKDAETGLINLDGMALYDEASENRQKGLYQKAISLYEELLDLYPNHPNAADAVKNISFCYNSLAQDEYIKKNWEQSQKLFEQTLSVDPRNTTATNGAISCILKLLDQHFEEEEYEKVEQKLTAATKQFGTIDDFANYQKKLNKKLEEIYPEDGQFVDKKIGGGRGELIVKSGSRDMLIKLESAENPEKFVTVYIHDNSEATISVADGVYRVKYAEGGTWYGKKYNFGENTDYTQVNELLEFQTRYEDGHHYYTEITLNIYAAANGNLDIMSLDEEAF